MGPDTQAGAAAGSFCIAKQTRAKTAGVAETRRARETGKPGPMNRHRGKAAWPHARRTAGPFSPTTREAEQVRPLGIASEVHLIGEHVRADFDILSLKVNSAGTFQTFAADSPMAALVITCQKQWILVKNSARFETGL